MACAIPAKDPVCAHGRFIKRGFNMKTNWKTSMSGLAAAALAAGIVVGCGPAFAQADEARGLVAIRYLQRTPGHAQQSSQHQPPGDIYQSNAQGHQSYPNPDRDFFSGANDAAEY
jgi:hypothetical protein